MKGDIPCNSKSQCSHMWVHWILLDSLLFTSILWSMYSHVPSKSQCTHMWVHWFKNCAIIFNLHDYSTWDVFSIKVQTIKVSLQIEVFSGLTKCEKIRYAGLSILIRKKIPAGRCSMLYQNTSLPAREELFSNLHWHSVEFFQFTYR